MTQQVSWPAANVRRLQRHALLPPAPPGADPAETAAVICGAHAQVLSAAELSIALRIQGATRATVGRALWDEHRLIKTYGPRGTVHLLAVDDLPMWTAALSAVPAHSPFPDGVRLTPEQMEQIVAAIGDALEDAELIIDELDQAVVQRVGTWAGERVMPAFQELWPRWRQAVGMAGHHGVLCFGRNRGRRVTYTNPRRWFQGLQPAPEEESIAEVIRRYLYAYGPATPKQFAQLDWCATGLGQRSVRAAQAGVDRGGLRGYRRLGGSWRHAVVTHRGRNGDHRAASLFRCVRRRQPSARPAISWQSARARVGAIRPSGQLSGPAH
jgi:hypothetical protein